MESEGTDVFTQEIGEDDPFAGSDFGDFGEPEETKTGEGDGSQAESDIPADTAGLPVVDREGQPVEPQPSGLPEMTEEERAENARAYREAHGEGEYAPQPRGEEAAMEADAATAHSTAMDEAYVPPPQDEPDPTGGTTEAAAPDASTEASGDAAAPAEGLVATADPAPPASAPPAPPTTASQSGDGTKKRTTSRKYVILKVVGPGKFEQVSWIVNREGKVVPEMVEGQTRRVAVANARGTEDALKVGYQALGAPAQGVKLIAVAAAYFKVQSVKAEADPVPKTRIKIG